MNRVGAGDTATVVDCTAAQNADGQTCGSAALAINGLVLAVSCATFEKLTAPPSVNAPAERQALATSIQNTPTAFGSVGNVLGGLGDDLKWAIITAAVVAAVILLKDVATEWT